MFGPGRRAEHVVTDYRARRSACCAAGVAAAGGRRAGRAADPAARTPGPALHGASRALGRSWRRRAGSGRGRRRDLDAARRARCSARPSRRARSSRGAAGTADGRLARAHARQAGFTGRHADDYRARVALQVFTFRLGGAVLGALVFHRRVAALGLTRVRGRVRCVAGARPPRPRDRRPAGAHPDRALHRQPAPRHSRAHRRRPGPSDAADRRSRYRGSSWTSSTTCSRPCATAWPNRMRSAEPRSSRRNRRRPARTSCARRRRTRGRSRRRSSCAERRPPRHAPGGDPQDRDEATRRDARSDHRGPGSGDAPVHRRTPAVHRLR